MAALFGKEVVVSVPGATEEVYEYPLTLQPGATPETILAALNGRFGTRYDPTEFMLVVRDPTQGRLAFGRGENVAEQVRDGTRLWVVPSGELSLGR